MRSKKKRKKSRRKREQRRERSTYLSKVLPVQTTPTLFPTICFMRERIGWNNRWIRVISTRKTPVQPETSETIILVVVDLEIHGLVLGQRDGATLRPSHSMDRVVVRHHDSVDPAGGKEGKERKARKREERRETKREIPLSPKPPYQLKVCLLYIYIYASGTHAQAHTTFF